jgi:hypothetical protein
VWDFVELEVLRDARVEQGVVYFLPLISSSSLQISSDFGLQLHDLLLLICSPRSSIHPAPVSKFSFRRLIDHTVWYCNELVKMMKFHCEVTESGKIKICIRWFFDILSVFPQFLTTFFVWKVPHFLSHFSRLQLRILEVPIGGILPSIFNYQKKKKKFW